MYSFFVNGLVCLWRIRQELGYRPALEALLGNMVLLDMLATRRQCQSLTSQPTPAANTCADNI